MKTQRNKKRTFSDTFKAQVVNDCQNSTVYSVAKRYNISISTIRKWVQKHQSIIDGANAIVSSNEISSETIEDKYQKLEILLLQKALTLAASSQNLKDILNALQHVMDWKINMKDKESLDEDSFIQDIIKKTQVIYDNDKNRISNQV